MGQPVDRDVRYRTQANGTKIFWADTKDVRASPASWAPNWRWCTSADAAEPQQLLMSAPAQSEYAGSGQRNVLVKKWLPSSKAAGRARKSSFNGDRQPDITSGRNAPANTSEKVSDSAVVAASLATAEAAWPAC